MKLVSSFTAGALLAGQAFAHPVGLTKRQENIDTTVLQFALTLEHLENVFYKRALDMLSEQMFVDAGFDASYYTNIQYIASDEASHVQGLSAALTAAGATPNEACEYKFPFTDVISFITLSSVLEGVGTSAYLGAAGLITSKDYLTVAGSILAVEALHTSLQRKSRGLEPSANPYYTPLSPNPVFTLAASFITSCPESNAPLPFMAFPTLMSDSDAPLSMGMSATFSYEGDKMEGDKYITFVSGLKIQSVMVEGDGHSYTVTVPMDVAGQSYAFLTNCDVSGGPGTLTDKAIIAGPAVIEVLPASPTHESSDY